MTGLDEVLLGGFPQGRPTLVCGGAGCGKTLMGLQFLVRGALDHGEPGVFIAFEEKAEDLRANVASLRFDLEDLESRGLLSIDHMRVERTEIVENGEYDLSGMFLRLGLAIDSIGAKRVVIDTLETLFGGLTDYGVIRSELRRLFEWLKEKGVTALITAERGDGTLTRHGLEEYVSDCVIVLDHRVTSQISTRRLRVVKYRGSRHGTNEFPFLIDAHGITVIPITGASLDHPASTERVSTGLPALDEMLGGQGYYRGSTVLLSGPAGSGKTSIAAYFVDGACSRGESAIYFTFEESPAQLVRNMASIGLDLQRHVDAGRLHFIASRPTSHGLEMHLALIQKEIDRLKPSVIVLDPASNFMIAGVQQDANALLVRLIDTMKRRQTTALITNLTGGGTETAEQTEIAISSIVDVWLLVKTIELAGERNRGLYVLKSRGMRHSNQIREFYITSRGLELVTPYIGPEGVLTGSARLSQEAREEAAVEKTRLALAVRKADMARLEAVHRERVLALASQYESELANLRHEVSSLEQLVAQRARDRENMARMRRMEPSDGNDHD